MARITVRATARRTLTVEATHVACPAITGDRNPLHFDEKKPVCQRAVRVARQTGEVVLEGEAWCYTFSPAA